MQNLRAVLFPHAYVSESKLKKVLSFFEKAVLFQPWFLEKTPPMARERPDLIELANPPEDCRPEKGFRTLLAEYKEWMRRNFAQGRASFPAVALNQPESDSPTWEIRSMIRNPEKSPGDDERGKCLKRHLTLHLAEDMEEGSQSAETLLRAVKGLDSPLRGALGEEDATAFLGDLPGLRSEDFFSEGRLAQVLDAWFGLFEDQATGQDPLITVNPRVMVHLAEVWEEFASEKPGSGLMSFTLLCPDLSSLPHQEFLERREASFAEDPRRKAVLGFFRDPEANFARVKDLAETPVSASGYLRWTFSRFPFRGDMRVPKRYEFIRRLSGKTVGLVEEEQSRGRSKSDQDPGT